MNWAILFFIFVKFAEFVAVIQLANQAYLHPNLQILPGPIGSQGNGFGFQGQGQAGPVAEGKPKRLGLWRKKSGLECLLIVEGNDVQTEHIHGITDFIFRHPQERKTRDHFGIIDR